MTARFLLWLGLPAVLLCARAGAAQVATGLTGQVVDDRSGEPIVGLVVRLAGTRWSAVTDHEGAFLIEGPPPGEYQVRFSHLAYGERVQQVAIRGAGLTHVRIYLGAAAIRLDSMTVRGLSDAERQQRGSGTSRTVVGREALADAARRGLSFEDVLARHVPAIRLRRQDNRMGHDLCIEMRALRVLNTSSCLSPAVFLDGALVTNPTSLYRTLDPEIIERVEVVPANEAGVRFGAPALYGAMLIETRRPGADRAPRKVPAYTRANFDWTVDPAGHRTVLVFLASAAGNAAGLALGSSAARACLHLRQPGNDGLVSDCGAGATIASAAAALVVPALMSGLGSQVAGATSISRGRLAPAAIGAGMALLPGYALVMSGKRNDSIEWEYTGYAAMLIGAPLMSTAADYLFRRLRR